VTSEALIGNILHLDIEDSCAGWC
jgi:hypothetical protein